MVRLPALLYQLVTILDARRSSAPRGTPPEVGCQTLAQVADVLSAETGRQFNSEHIAFLVDKKLAPLGVTTYTDGTAAPLAKASQFLGFRFRATLLSERATWFLSGLLAWLYKPLLAVLALGAFTVGEVWLLVTQNSGAALAHVLYMPASILLVVALAVASAAFHELGHATACRSAGVRPGAMGFGIYVVWPAFYTDITNSYRLGRAGRIRTDLGGVYFNAIFVVGLILLYRWTGFSPLLVAVLSTNLEIIQQLLPTLRFDGYYIVADIVGIPDLFKYIGPILKRVLLRRPPDSRLNALKRWPQLVVTVWVIFVIPALFLQLGIVAIQIPQLIRADWQRIRTLSETAGASGNYVLGLASSSVQILMLLLPVIGVILIIGQLVRAVIRLASRRRRPAHRLPAGARPHPKPLRPLRQLRVGLAVVVALLLLGGAGSILVSSWSARHPAAAAPSIRPLSPPPAPPAAETAGGTGAPIAAAPTTPPAGSAPVAAPSASSRISTPPRIHPPPPGSPPPGSPEPSSPPPSSPAPNDAPPAPTPPSCALFGIPFPVCNL